MRPTIYFDMDGCLAKWYPASVEETYKSGYFLERVPQENLIRAVKRLNEDGYPVSILSSVYTEGTAKKDKQEWLKKMQLEHIPALLVPYGQPKCCFASGMSILVDDFSQNLREWEASGLTGIKFYNEVNGTKGTWDGFSISHKMTTGKMLVIIKAVAKDVSMRFMA